MQIDLNRKILDGYFVKSIAFDSQGNAWIGTFKQGLIKYNSSGTTVYNSANSIIPDTSVIYDIAVDSNDNIWIGCEGLIRYDGTEFIQYNSSNTSIPEDFVYSIAIDSEDNIWFNSCRFRQGGIVKYDGNDWKVDNTSFKEHGVFTIEQAADGSIWMGTGDGIHLCVPQKCAHTILN